MEHEFAFDVKLTAVVRVRAMTLQAAVKAVRDTMEELVLNFVIASEHGELQIGQASLPTNDKDSIQLFEIGEEPADFMLLQQLDGSTLA